MTDYNTLTNYSSSLNEANISRTAVEAQFANYDAMLQGRHVPYIPSPDIMSPDYLDLDYKEETIPELERCLKEGSLI